MVQAWFSMNLPLDQYLYRMRAGCGGGTELVPASLRLHKVLGVHDQGAMGHLFAGGGKGLLQRWKSQATCRSLNTKICLLVLPVASQARWWGVFLKIPIEGRFE